MTAHTTYGGGTYSEHDLERRVVEAPKRAGVAGVRRSQRRSIVRTSREIGRVSNTPRLCGAWPTRPRLSARATVTHLARG